LGANLTAEDLKEAIIQYWLQVTAKEGGPNKSDDTELTLSACSGKCYNCGGEGHKANECKKPKKDGTKSRRQGSKKNLKCYNCGGPGHMAKDCWEKEENKDKRPKGWKSKTNKTGKQGGAAVDNRNVCEFLLCSLTFPTKQQMLTNKNI
jgi:Zinc knuckle